jgi:hypothetical protein
MADQFNPYGLRAIHIPLGMLNYPRLSWGAKMLYGRLALFLGRPKSGSYCNPDLPTMAAELGVSVDTVGRFLNELIRERFIKRNRKGRGPAECIFLANRYLSDDDPNSAALRNQSSASKPTTRIEEPPNSADLRNQSDALTPQPSGSNSAIPPVQFRNSAVSIPQLCGSRNKEENIQEDIHENSHEDINTDSRSASQKTAKPDRHIVASPPEPISQRPLPEMQIPSVKPEPDDELRRALASYFHQDPDDRTLRSIMAALNGSPVSGFCRYLDAMPLQYRVYGKAGPRTWGWFLSTARNYANIPAPLEPTDDRCRHGKPYHACCNRPEENDAMTEAF